MLIAADSLVTVMVPLLTKRCDWWWVVICVKSIVLFDYSVRGGKYRQLQV